VIDLYCERTTEGLFAEPLNLVTNLGFILAAYFLFKIAARHNKLAPSIKILILLTIAIGQGSALFHMFANRFTQILDVIPIFLFQIIFLVVYLRHVVGQSSRNEILLCSFFILMSILSTQFSQTLNNSLSYAPSLLSLLGIGVYQISTKKKFANHILIAAFLFFIALIFRTLDPLLCNYFPIGTHFMWHILNSIVIYLIMKVLILNFK